MKAPVLAEKASHPLAAFGLDMLARGAARLRGDRPAISEAGPAAAASALTYRDLDRLVVAFAARAIECGLKAGDRVVVLGATRIGAIVAILGSLAAGLEPVIAPAHFSAGALAFLAQSTGATAVFGPTLFGGLDAEQLLLEAAALAPDIRVVGSLGPGVGDGMIDFSQQGLGGGGGSPARVHREEAPRIGLALRADQRAPRAAFLTQSAIVAQALDIVAAARMTADRTIVSTLSPASPAGLIAGPVAALLAGAPLVLFGPFDAAGLTLLVDRSAPCHLIAPEAVGESLVRSGFCGSLASLALARPVGVSATFSARHTCPLLVLQPDVDGRLAVSTSLPLESVDFAGHSGDQPGASATFD